MSGLDTVKNKTGDMKPTSVEFGGQCAPVLGVCTDGAGGTHSVGFSQDAAGTAEPFTQVLYRIDGDWRKACLAERKCIPAGYTYLAQLLGHDMGCSVPLGQMPCVIKVSVAWLDHPPEEKPKDPVRYNLIENPLTLETIYGPGPQMLNHVFDPDTWLFRLPRGFTCSKLFEFGETRIRALYDKRNRDTLMLHELTVAWMQFHNRNAEILMNGGQAPQTAYQLARTHSVATWHRIIREDILPRFVLPEIMAIDAAKLEPAWRLDEVTLLHGLFRAFHCMPRGSYPISIGLGSGTQNLGHLMPTGFSNSTAENDWTIDWPLFFGTKDRSPLSAICASIDPKLHNAGQLVLLVAQLDQTTMAETAPLDLESPAIISAREALPEKSWIENVTAEMLAKTWHDTYGNKAPTISAEEIRQQSLAQALLIEAQLHGPDGKFGPLGSVLLRASVEASLGRVRLETAPAQGTKTLKPPPALLEAATMLELIQQARE